MKCRGVRTMLSLCLYTAITMQGQVSGGATILPGKSVAGVQLGSTVVAFERIFPKKQNTDEDLPVNGCGIGGYHWVDVAQGATGIYAYIKGNEIIQFSVKTPRFSLPNGVKAGSTEANVRHAYPQGRAYVLVHSNSAVMGGKNLMYWVDKEDGVAFELYWNRKARRRLVSSIEIFRAGTKYLPEGCISPPQIWKALN